MSHQWFMLLVGHIPKVSSFLHPLQYQIRKGHRCLLHWFFKASADIYVHELIIVLCVWYIKITATPVTMWINKIFCGKRVPMLLRLETWRVEILTDDVHMQLAEKYIFTLCCSELKILIFCKNCAAFRQQNNYIMHKPNISRVMAWSYVAHFVHYQQNLSVEDWTGINLMLATSASVFATLR